MFANQKSINIKMSNETQSPAADDKPATNLDKTQSAAAIPGAHSNPVDLPVRNKSINCS